MSRKRYKDHAAKREGGGFVPLPHVVLRSGEFAALSPRASKLLLDLLAQYRGDNNGNLCAAFSIMQGRGWRGKSLLARAIGELKASDFLVETRKGGRHKAALFAVSFYAIDACSGKLDIEAPTRRFMGLWHRHPAPDPGAGNRVTAPTSARTKTRGDVATPPMGQFSGDYPARGVIRTLHKANCPARSTNQATFLKRIAPPVGSFLELPLRAAA